MSRDGSFMQVLRLMEKRKDNLVKVDFDPDKTYAKPFTKNDHYYALGIGLFCFGLTIILTFFIR